MKQEPPSLPRQIYLLGALRIFKEGLPYPLNGERSQSLFTYLALHPHLPHRREKLAELLFPDAPFERVRRNFTDTLYRVQKVLGGEWFVIESDTVALRINEDLWVDVWEFERLAVSSQQVDLKKAVDLYAGDLLPELYDDWLLSEREFIRNQYLSALEKLAALQEGSGEFPQALLTLRRLVSTEPLHEPAHQSYLRLLGRLQRYGEALAHYEYLQRLLRSELDTEPLAETRQIAQTVEQERHVATIQTVVEERLPFTGRKSERASALASVESMLNGEGGILAIEGEAGIGKSRLLREIMPSIRWRGASILQGVTSEAPSTSPFSPLVDALAPLIHSPRGMQLESLMANETLATLAPLNPEWKRKAVLYEIPPKLAGNRFYDALSSFGVNLARLTPTVLAIDDLQWADLALWKSLDILAQSMARSGALVIVIYRRPEIEHTPGWEVIQAWDRAGLMKSISLQPLAIEEVTQLVGNMQATDSTEVYAWTGGNPFYLSEWLATPGSNKSTRQNTATLRLQKLSPTARLALESACVLGENIPYRLWTEISGLPPLTLAGLSDELVAHNWLQPSTSGYAFTHDLIRRGVYQEIEPGRRVVLHERAAHTYLALEPDNLNSRAFHFDQAGFTTEAAIAYRLAGKKDLARFAFREAQKSLDRALSLMPVIATDDRIETALALAQVCDVTGDRVRQKSALDEALIGIKEDNPLRLQALLASGRCATQTGQIAEAETLLGAALPLARYLRDQTQETEAFILLGALARERSHWDEAKRYYEQALKLARAISDSSREALSLSGLGYVADDQSASRESIQWLEQASTIYRSIGDRFRMAYSQVGLAAALGNLSEWDRMLAISTESIEILEAYGNRSNVAVARHNQAFAYHALGDYVKARQNLEQNIKVFNTLRNRRALGITQDLLGNVAEAEENFEEALSLYRAALANSESVDALDGMAFAQYSLGALLERLGKQSDAVSALEAARALWKKQGNLLLREMKTEAILGLALLALGDRARAKELAASGWETFQSGSPMSEQLQEWLWNLYRLLMALEMPDFANPVLRSAYAELNRQANNIGNSDLRRSFFERVSTNRAIVEAYDRLSQVIRLVSVSLAHRNAPLGRLLRNEEYVSVQWMVNAPEDEAITNKSARRQYRLKRLLQQAENQNAAPTDEDLAQALGVQPADHFARYASLSAGNPQTSNS